MRDGPLNLEGREWSWKAPNTNLQPLCMHTHTLVHIFTYRTQNTQFAQSKGKRFITACPLSILSLIQSEMSKNTKTKPRGGWDHFSHQALQYLKIIQAQDWHSISLAYLDSENSLESWENRLFLWFSGRFHSQSLSWIFRLVSLLFTQYGTVVMNWRKYKMSNSILTTEFLIRHWLLYFTVKEYSQLQDGKICM